MNHPGATVLGISGGLVLAGAVASASDAIDVAAKLCADIEQVDGSFTEAAHASMYDPEIGEYDIGFYENGICSCQYSYAHEEFSLSDSPDEIRKKIDDHVKMGISCSLSDYYTLNDDGQIIDPESNYVLSRMEPSIEVPQEVIDLARMIREARTD